MASSCLSAVHCFMIYGHARIPITEWLRENATESLAHAQETGEMIMWPHKRPDLGIARLPITRDNTIGQILAESVEREEAGVQPYRDLMENGQRQVDCTRGICAALDRGELVRMREMKLMLMTSAPSKERTVAVETHRRWSRVSALRSSSCSISRTRAPRSAIID
jgi:bacterioferritin (cytochrome b1)